MSTAPVDTTKISMAHAAGVVVVFARRGLVLTAGRLAAAQPKLS